MSIKPFATAPRDGTYILVTGPAFASGAAVVQWSEYDDGWVLDDGKFCDIYLRNQEKVTGWMPLPDLEQKLNSLKSAPKNGTYFLMVGDNFDGGAAVVRRYKGRWNLDNGEKDEIALRHQQELKGWLPLPEAIQAYPR